MPIVPFPEFEKYRAQGFKGVFVGGCVERGDGSSFRAKAHAHNEQYVKIGSSKVMDENGNPKEWKHFGWICVRSAKRLYTRPGQPSNLMWHELAHILTPGHSHDDVWRAKAREFGVYIGKRYAKQRRPEMGRMKKGKRIKEVVAAVDKNKAEATTEKVAVDMGKIEVNPIMVVTGDAGAKKMGVAKAGGNWYKNYETGMLYRVTEDKAGKLTLAETVKPTKAQAENAKIAAAVAKKAAVKAPSKQVEKATEKFRKEVLAGKMAKTGIPKAEVDAAVARTAKEVRAAVRGKTCSRAALMQELKEKGVAYFRILNKEELQTVKDMYDHAVKTGIKEPAKIAGITEIIETAKKRWQKCPFFQKKAKKA